MGVTRLHLIPVRIAPALFRMGMGLLFLRLAAMRGGLSLSVLFPVLMPVAVILRVRPERY